MRSLLFFFCLLPFLATPCISTGQTFEFRGVEFSYPSGTSTSRVDGEFEESVSAYVYSMEVQQFMDDTFYTINLSFFQGITNGAQEGSLIGFSYGGYEPSSDIFAFGAGLYGDFGWSGVRQIGGVEELTTFAMIMGLEFPYSISFNDWSRIHGKARIGNTWNDQRVFSGYDAHFGAELHLIPTDYFILSAGFSANRRTSTIEYRNTDGIRLKTSFIAFNLGLNLSFRGYSRY